MARVDVRTIEVAIEPALAEAVVDARLQGPRDLLQRRLASRYRRAADRLYSDHEGDARERAFQGLSASLFTDLGHRSRIVGTFKDFPRITSALDRLVVLHAHGTREEGPDLASPHLRDTARTEAVLRITPERFVDPRELQAFLRFSWLQLDDLLNPAFGYEPDRLPAAASPAELRTLLEAYGLIWAAYTLARMRHRGWRTCGDHERLVAGLDATGMGDSAEGQAVLRRLTLSADLSHATLLDAARAVVALRKTRTTDGGGVCTLCHFPATSGAHVADIDNARARAVLRREYSHISGFVCTHCTERLAILGAAAASVPTAA